MFFQFASLFYDALLCNCLHHFPFQFKIHHSFSWTPTLAHYTGLQEGDLSAAPAEMLERALDVVRGRDAAKNGVKSSNGDGANVSGVVKKFSSRSRHQAIIKNEGRGMLN